MARHGLKEISVLETISCSVGNYLVALHHLLGEIANRTFTQLTPIPEFLPIVSLMLVAKWTVLLRSAFSSTRLE